MRETKTTHSNKIPDVIKGSIYVVRDDVDAEQLLVAFSREGHPPGRFPLVVAGKRFGCGDAHERGSVALQDAGVLAVIAESFAQAFHHSSVNGGRLILCETQRERLCETITTGMEGELILANSEKPTLYVAALKTSWALGSVAEILPTLQAGALFARARERGFINTA